MALFQDFFHLFFPQLCEACSSALFAGEEQVCLRCRAKLPYTFFAKQPENMVSRLFWGRVKLERAASVYFYHKGNRIQVLMHALKYKGRKDLGILMGEWMYEDIHSEGWLDDVDALHPVPLHPQKEKQRGYNQALQLAIGFSHQSAIPLIKNAVVKQLHSGSQTRLSRFARWQNAEAGYEAGDLEKVRGKHVLLIDDVVTTGATLEACARVLIEQGNCRVSVLTAACAIQ